ncbi:MAG TPA: BatD family protein [Verrucomicrobiae bacterium]|nr:BatD family protein [Verrucomicrobiae bacterium]
MKTILKRTATMTLTVWVAGTLGLAQAASVIATLEPTDISVGEAAQLTVTVQGRSADEPQVPTVKGLDFQPVGQSSQIQVINGAMSANVSYTYAVAATQPGSFTIPAIKTGRGADTAVSQPVVLKVRRGAGGASAMSNPSQNSLPAPAVSGDEGQISAAEQQSFGFLRLVAPKKEFYVGEMVPVELKACFRAGVELRVDGLPKLNSDAFTMNQLGNQPVRSQQLINGVPYTVFTWPTVITAVKAGDYEMSVELPTTVTVRQPAQRPRSRLGSPFDDDFFDQAFSSFFGSATQKQIALSSDPNSVKILSLPAENRPASFTGAVGQFDLTAETAPTQTTVGDPVTLKLKISGVGNFDRVTAPAVEKNDAWKTYKPGAKFEAADSAGYSGAKLFEQALIPTQAGKLEIPALAFSYFDPEKKQYVTRTTPPVNVEVAPGQSVASSTPPAAATQTTTPAAASAPTDLAPNKPAPGHFTATLRPWFLNPWIVAVALSPSILALIAYLILRRRQKLARNPKRVCLANSRRVLRTQLESMERAAAAGDTGSFFAAACGAFQNLLGLRWSLPPRTITLAEINARLNGEADGLRTIFSLADEAVYTGRAFAPDELRHFQMLVNDELKKLEAL